jgi:Family of unknown function (DUF6459)
MTASPSLPLPTLTPTDPAAPLTQGTLALNFPLASGVPAVPQAPALTLVVGGAETVPGTGAPVPAPGAWAGRFVQAVVGVVAGDRPLQQMVRWTNERVYADLSRRVRILGLSTSAASRHRTERSHVRSVHVFQPRPDAAEVAAHVRHGSRSRAVAARLEAERGRWTCTALQLG